MGGGRVHQPTRGFCPTHAGQPSLLPQDPKCQNRSLSLSLSHTLLKLFCRVSEFAQGWRLALADLSLETLSAHSLLGTPDNSMTTGCRCSPPPTWQGPFPGGFPKEIRPSEGIPQKFDGGIHTQAPGAGRPLGGGSGSRPTHPPPPSSKKNRRFPGGTITNIRARDSFRGGDFLCAAASKKYTIRSKQSKCQHAEDGCWDSGENAVRAMVSSMPQ